MKLATLVYLKHNGRTLMVHRNRKPGESPHACAVREVLEESGLHIHDPRLRGLLIFPAFKGDDWYVFVFPATEFSGALIDLPEGDLRWIPDAEFDSLPLWPSDRIFLPWLEGSRFFSARFVYAGDVLQNYHVEFS